jgi:transcriptional regulator with XRE-family HTH domain
MRHYTAEIEGKTKESRGNISDYYNGKKPISNNFLKKFHKAYDRLLKKIREAIPSTEPTLAVNIPVQPVQVKQEEQPPNVAIDPPLISEYLSNFQEIIMEKLINIEARLERLEQKIEPPAAHPKKD